MCREIGSGDGGGGGAATRVTTLKIAKDLFLRMLTDFPVMALEVMRDLGRKLEHANEMVRKARA
jgi:CRP-like cAMP-binding protein